MSPLRRSGTRSTGSTSREKHRFRPDRETARARGRHPTIPCNESHAHALSGERSPGHSISACRALQMTVMPPSESAKEVNAQEVAAKKRHGKEGSAKKDHAFHCTRSKEGASQQAVRAVSSYLDALHTPSAGAVRSPCRRNQAARAESHCLGREGLALSTRSSSDRSRAALAG